MAGRVHRRHFHENSWWQIRRRVGQGRSPQLSEISRRAQCAQRRHLDFGWEKQNELSVSLPLYANVPVGVRRAPSVEDRPALAARVGAAVEVFNMSLCPTRIKFSHLSHEDDTVLCCTHCTRRISHNQTRAVEFIPWLRPNLPLASSSSSSSWFLRPRPTCPSSSSWVSESSLPASQGPPGPIWQWLRMFPGPSR